MDAVRWEALVKQHILTLIIAAANTKTGSSGSVNSAWILSKRFFFFFSAQRLKPLSQTF